MNSPSQNAIITGASSGIGLQICIQFAPHFDHMILVSSNEDRLRHAATMLRTRFQETKFSEIVCDLADPPARTRLIDQLCLLCETYSLLVNNAGVGMHGRFTSLNLDDSSRLMQVNAIAPMELSYWLINHVKKKQNSQLNIINIISIAAFYPGPFMAMYYASKGFLHRFFSAIQYEETEVHILNVYPGPVHTDFLRRANMEGSPAFNLFAISAERIALETFHAWKKKKKFLIPGKRNRVLYYLHQLIPERVSARIVAFYQEGKKKGA